MMKCKQSITKAVSLAPWLLALVAHNALAETPCDFKGVSVGDRMTPAQIMEAFGIKSYKMNPKGWPFDKLASLANKYGTTAAVEIEEWDIGPACNENGCRVPFGVSVGNSNNPVSVYVAYSKGLITEIDVSFNQIYWDENRSVIDQKYGAFWRVETTPHFIITDLAAKERVKVERFILTHRKGGINARSGDTCEIWATNFDMIFAHHDPLGMFHSVFVIRLVSKNF